MKGSIEITVTPEGDIAIEGVGFKGADCEHATKYLEEALGVVEQKSRKPEFHQRTRQQQQHQQRLGQ